MINDGFSVSDCSNDLDEAISKGGLYCATYHGIETGWVITGKVLFTSHMDALIKKKDQLWIATFREVVAYHREGNSATLSVVAESRRKWRLRLTDTLSDNIAYNVPLTIRIKKPSGRRLKSIKQNGRKIPYRTDGDSIQFDAVPDNRVIVFTKRK
ncbi:MAG: hypothetical protein WKI04_15195 [Ferruginibacter sp.]